MKINVTNKEETGRVRYVVVDLEVKDGGNVYGLSATIAETYDSNSDSTTEEVEIIWGDDLVISDEQKEEIKEKVEEYLKRVDI